MFDMTDADKKFDASFMRGEGRDPERIDRVLALIGEVWRVHPQMRLLQLLVCAIDHEPNRLFNVEDDILIERLNELVETGAWPTAQNHGSSGVGDLRNG